jgi:excinuclease ABC subunit A
MNNIKITNARVNNLKNVSISIPKNKLTVITGLSGSGKSSLAFDTIYAEGQRRYAESLNAYARQFMGVQDKPDVDEIQGLSPTIAIDQKNTTQNPRSTVGTTTEIYDYLRLLFSKIGIQHCSDCELPLNQYTTGKITEIIRTMARKDDELTIISPFISEQKIKPRQIMPHLEQSGYKKMRINGVEMSLHEIAKYKFQADKKYDIDIILGKITDVKKQDVNFLVDKAIDLSNGSLIVINEETGDENLYSTEPICKNCGKKFQKIEPRSFSFNSPYGACGRCTGLGRTLDVDPELAIPNPKLTLAEGAIQPWTRIVGNQSYYQKLLQVVSEKNNFSLDKPVKDLSKKIMNIILYGTDGKEYIVGNKKVTFEGVVPNLIQRHAETNSDYVRKEIEQYMKEKKCPICEGKRLKTESLHIKINDYSIADMAEMTIEEVTNLFKEIVDLKSKFNEAFTINERKIINPIAKEINKRIKNLMQVGLYYLTLDRSVTTLSGGESQRVRLSTQLSTGLTGVIYILDEPSIGLHPKDNNKLIETLKALRDIGNTVIVVEHDATMMLSADNIIDVGPGAGEYGGEILAEGTPTQIKKNKNSITGKYLSGQAIIKTTTKPRKGHGKSIDIIGAKAFNLKNIDANIPLGKFVCVTGVSGSGKSTLINNILAKSLSKHFYRAKAEPGEHKKINGISKIDKIISIDQTPIGRTPRSNPATYTGVFTYIRDLFTSVPEAKMRGMNAGSFSFNVKGGGRCEACSGEGYVRIPMQFLSDVFIECSECEGKRYNREALEIHYRNKNISDVLQMTIEEAYRFFNDTPAIADKLQVLLDVGLDYIKLGQPATTISGGEAQRVKLATELSKRATGKTLYILDEPTTGLHFEDIKKLLQVLNKLTDKGNTVLIIEHNLDVIKSSDWVIDLGPAGGKRGGEIIAEGTPQEIAKNKESFTGKYLKEII